MVKMEPIVTELELSKHLIVTYLSQAQTPDALCDLYEIRSGNDSLLLEHINALISIFKKAKKELERKQKSSDG